MAKKPQKASKKKGRKVRVDFRKNREKTVRDKSQWTRFFRDDHVQSDDAEKGENVRAKGATSRKRTIIVDDAKECDWVAPESPSDHRSRIEAQSPIKQAEQKLRVGIVVRMAGLIAEVDDGRERWACTIRRLLRSRLIKERHPITVGDRVRFLPVESATDQRHPSSPRGDGAPKLTIDDRLLHEGVIEQVAERRTTLVRHYDRRQQVVAANVDIALIVMAADQPTLRPHLIDRYLIAIHQGNMRPVLCINKMDLDIDGEAEKVARRYDRIGYCTLQTSILKRTGLDALRDTLRDQTTVLVGSSGVGKSSLINAIDSHLSLSVGSLTDLKRGRHTTTSSSLLALSFGGYVVDTPGIRQFDPAELEATELEAYFAEFVDLIPHCHFPNCSHTHESDCAVKAAVESGDVSPQRYDSYCKLYAECRAREREKYD